MKAPLGPLLAGAAILLCLSARAETPFKACEKKLAVPLEIWSSGWSREYTQHRLYDAEQAGLTATELSLMEVAWTFVFEDTVQPRSLPAITDKAVFVGSEEGAVFALNTQTGCGYWRYQAQDQIRTAISVGDVGGRWLVFFGDNTASAYAVDALTGQLVWRRQLDELAFSVITGSPVLYRDKLLVPVASWSVGLAMNPWGGCCKFRGSLSSLNALTGELIWQTYTIAETPQPTARNWLGGQQWGPSGAGLWSSPTVDEKRQRIYIGTGQNYSSPATQTSDAILALDFHSGKLLWSKQVLPEDAWNVACAFSWLDMNCPEEKGQDYDFGAPPMLITRADGKDVIVSGTKGGVAYAFDPDREGEILWQRSVGRGGVIGGIHWGMAGSSEYIYAPVADTDAHVLSGQATPGEARPGLNKLDILTGELLWHRSTQDICEGKDKKCRTGISAAITGIPGAILAPTLDGVLRAFSTEDGAPLWQFDSTHKSAGVNGISGHGGTMDAGGVVVARGMMFFNSGYGGLISAGGKGGNVFWVLRKSTKPASSSTFTAP